MNILEENVNMLKNFDFEEILSNLSVREINGELVSYLNLLVDKSSKAFISLSQEVMITDNGITTPVAIKRKSFEGDFRLELIVLEGEKIPADVQEVIKQSFELFNQGVM